MLKAYVAAELMARPAIGYEAAELERYGFKPVAAPNRPTHWILQRKKHKGCIIFFHGNGETAACCATIDQDYPQLAAWDVVLAEFPGYADPSEPLAYSQRVLLDDAIDLHGRILALTLGGRSTPMVAWGRSLGGAVAAQLAASVELDGLVLESTFSCLTDAAKCSLPRVPKAVIQLATQSFPLNTCQALAHVAAPVLIAHSNEDEFFPTGHAERLYDAALSPKRLHQLYGLHNAEKCAQAGFRRALLALCDAAVDFQRAKVRLEG